MKIDITIIFPGIMIACGVYLLLEKALLKILLGLLIIGNALNMLLLIVSGKAKNPALSDFFTVENMSDPLAQALDLTSIVLSMATGAFIIALSFRSFQNIRADYISDDAEDISVGSPTRSHPVDEIIESEDVYVSEESRVDRVPSPVEMTQDPTGDLEEPIVLDQLSSEEQTNTEKVSFRSPQAED